MGDFTELCLLEVNINKEKSIIENAKEIQDQLLNDMAHSSYSSIDFIREIRKIKKVEEVAPIVFTSGLGMGEISTSDFLGNNSYSISQTPQVWIDHQIMEVNGDLILSFDRVEEIINKPLITRIIDQYNKLLSEFIKNPDFDIFINSSFNNQNKNDKNYEVNEYSKENIREIIKSIWNKILGNEIKDYEKSFFELGGDSLGLVKIKSEIEKQMKVKVELIDLINNNSINLISNYLFSILKNRKQGFI